jgi:hypothetical protein
VYQRGTIYYKGKLTESCKNKGYRADSLLEERQRPLKAWNEEMTGGRNKPHYVWAPSLTTLSPCQSTKGKAKIQGGHPKMIVIQT